MQSARTETQNTFAGSTCVICSRCAEYQLGPLSWVNPYFLKDESCRCTVFGAASSAGDCKKVLQSSRAVVFGRNSESTVLPKRTKPNIASGRPLAFTSATSSRSCRGATR